MQGREESKYRPGLLHHPLLQSVASTQALSHSSEANCLLLIQGWGHQLFAAAVS